MLIFKQQIDIMKNETIKARIISSNVEKASVHQTRATERRLPCLIHHKNLVLDLLSPKDWVEMGEEFGQLIGSISIGNNYGSSLTGNTLNRLIDRLIEDIERLGN